MLSLIKHARPGHTNVLEPNNMVVDSRVILMPHYRTKQYERYPAAHPPRNTWNIRRNRTVNANRSKPYSALSRNEAIYASSHIYPPTNVKGVDEVYNLLFPNNALGSVLHDKISFDHTYMNSKNVYKKNFRRRYDMLLEQIIDDGGTKDTIDSIVNLVTRLDEPYQTAFMSHLLQEIKLKRGGGRHIYT